MQTSRSKEIETHWSARPAHSFRKPLSVNTTKLFTTLTASVLALLSFVSAATPSVAMQPLASSHTVVTVSPKALLASGITATDLGDLTHNRFINVTATGITGAGVTVIFQGLTARVDAHGNNIAVSRKAFLTNNVSVLLDFGEVVNPTDQGNSIIAIWYQGNQQANMTLNLYSPVVSSTAP